MIAMHLYNTLCKGQYTLNFMVQRYSSLIALRHYRGHYLLANKISSIFQYDVNNRLTACLHEFTIINDEYNGEPLGPKFFTATGQDEERGIEILQKTIEHFLNMKVFSPKEMQVARKIAYHPGIKQKQLAEVLEISVNDVHQYYNRVLKKARDFFHLDFTNTVEAAIYLKKEGLLKLFFLCHPWVTTCFFTISHFCFSGLDDRSFRAKAKLIIQKQLFHIKQRK